MTVTGAQAVKQYSWLTNIGLFIQIQNQTVYVMKNILFTEHENMLNEQLCKLSIKNDINFQSGFSPWS